MTLQSRYDTTMNLRAIFTEMTDPNRYVPLCFVITCGAVVIQMHAFKPSYALSNLAYGIPMVLLVTCCFQIK
jgi:hypothetical protein